MAKQEDLKRVDLKVTVNCCDGCKRKVMKALSIKGVLQTEIHPTLPKVTVIGNVDNAILIRRLSKIGKTAQVLPEPEKKQTEGKKPETDKKPTENNNKEKEQAKNCSDDKPKSNPGPKSEAPSDTKKSNENKNESKSGEQEAKKHDDSETTKTATNPTVVTNATAQMNYVMNQNMMQNYANLMAAQPSVYYHPVEPVVMPMMRYHNMNAYCSPSPNYHHGRPGYYYDLPPYQPPPYQPHTTVFADYFNEDNTVGCHVM